MIGQDAIIKGLYKNICPKCKRNYMYATVREYVRKKTYHIGCNFCCTTWEITKEVFEENVRVKDTFSYKQDNGW